MVFIIKLDLQFLFLESGTSEPEDVNAPQNLTQKEQKSRKGKKGRASKYFKRL